MSFGDETHPGLDSFLDPLTPRRNVVQLHPTLHPARSFGPPARHCSNATCQAETREPGTLCSTCREAQPAVSAAFVQATVADAIRNLERLAEQGRAPMALPLQQAFASMRRAFDSLNPLIQSFNVGGVQEEAGQFYAYPFSSSERLGPFGQRGLAEHALVQHALEFGDWDTEQGG